MKSDNLPDQTSLRAVGMEAVSLISCALHGRVPEQGLPENPDLLFRFCSRHSITALVAMALETCWKSTPPKNPHTIAPWKQAKEKAIRKNILLNAERERILQHLEQIGCWYMPLKGSLLQYDYPKFGMRQMTDNDILYDVRFTDQIQEFMSHSGYTLNDMGTASHYAFTKAPVYNYEMHHRLFSPLAQPVLADYYRAPLALMVKDEGNQYGYHFSHEDFYIYMIAHDYKHFSRGGIGLRTLVDMYVFLRNHENQMDREYLEAQLRRLEVWEFEQCCRNLCQKLFDVPERELPLTSEEQSLLDVFFGSGTHGNRQQEMKNKLDNLERQTHTDGNRLKWQYFWRRLFPSPEFMAVMEPELALKKWKLPFAYLKRILKGLFRKPGQLLRELEYLLRSDRAEK